MAKAVAVEWRWEGGAGPGVEPAASSAHAHALARARSGRRLVDAGGRAWARYAPVATPAGAGAGFDGAFDRDADDEEEASRRGSGAPAPLASPSSQAPPPAPTPPPPEPGLAPPLLTLFDPFYPRRDAPVGATAAASASAAGDAGGGGGALAVRVELEELAFDAGALEPLWCTLSLVDTASGAKLSADARLVPPGAPNAPRGSPAPALEVRVPSPHAALKVLLLVHHVAPDAGGVSDKVYTLAEPRKALEAERFRRGKRAAEPLGNLAEPPKTLLAWGAFELFEEARTGRAGALQLAVGKLRLEKLHRVKEAVSEAALIAAAAAPPDVPHAHKPLLARAQLSVRRLGDAGSSAWGGLAHPPTPTATTPASPVTPVATPPPPALARPSGASLEDIPIELLPDSMAGAAAAAATPAGPDVADPGARAAPPALTSFWEPPSGTLRELYVSPCALSLSRKADVRVRVELHADDVDPGAGGLPVFRTGAGALAGAACTSGSLPSKPVLWCEELCVLLPVPLPPEASLVFTFYARDASGGNVMTRMLHSVEDTPSKPETLVGYAVLPLTSAPNVIAPGVGGKSELPVAKELLPKFLQPNVRGAMKYIEDSKPVFAVRTRLVSAMHTKDTLVGAFYTALDAYADGSGKGDALTGAVLELDRAAPRELALHVQPCVLVLLQLLVQQGSWNWGLVGMDTDGKLKRSAFVVLLRLVSRVQGPDGRGQAGALAEICHAVYDGTDPPADALAVEICKLVFKLVEQAVQNAARGDGKERAAVIEYAFSSGWFLLSLVARCLALAATPPPVAEGGQVGVPEAKAFPQETWTCVRGLFHTLLGALASKRDASPVLADRLNVGLAVFCAELLSAYPSEPVVELVSLYLSTVADKPELIGIQQGFMHALAACDFFASVTGELPPTETEGSDAPALKYAPSMDAGRASLMNELITTVFAGLSRPDTATQRASSRVLAEILTRLAYDKRLQSREARSSVSAMYAKVLTFVMDAEASGVLEKADAGARRDVYACAVSLLEEITLPDLEAAVRAAGRRSPLEGEEQTAEPSPESASASPLVRVLVSVTRCFAYQAGKEGATLLADGAGAKLEGDGDVLDAKRLMALEADLCSQVSVVCANTLSVLLASPPQKVVASTAVALELLCSLLARPQSLPAWEAMQPVLTAVLWDRAAESFADEHRAAVRDAATSLFTVAGSATAEFQAQGIYGLNLLIRGFVAVRGSLAAMRSTLVLSLYLSLHRDARLCRRMSLRDSFTAMLEGGDDTREADELLRTLTRVAEAARAELLARERVDPPVDRATLLESANDLAVAVVDSPVANARVLQAMAAVHAAGGCHADAGTSSAAAAAVLLRPLADSSGLFAAELSTLYEACPLTRVAAQRRKAVEGDSGLTSTERDTGREVEAYLESAARSYLEAGQLLAAEDLLRVRAAVLRWIDDVPSQESLGRTHRELAAVYRSLHDRGVGTADEDDASYLLVQLHGPAFGEEAGASFVHREGPRVTAKELARRLRNATSTDEMRRPRALTGRAGPTPEDLAANASAVHVLRAEPAGGSARTPRGGPTALVDTFSVDADVPLVVKTAAAFPEVRGRLAVVSRS